ncbi:MAG: hypothetical protein ACE5H9_08655 [Anaerolineae bacterium]
MWRTKWLVMLASLSLVVSACATTLGSGTPGLPAPAREVGFSPGQAAGPLQALANTAEGLDPALDVVQIELDEEGDLVVFVILTAPAGGQSDNTALVRTSVEAVWQATVEHAPEASRVSVAFLRVVLVNTLDYGPARSGWLVGAITAPMDKIADYLNGPRTDEAAEAFWKSGAVATIPFDRPYNGQPNHPIHSYRSRVRPDHRPGLDTGAPARQVLLPGRDAQSLQAGRAGRAGFPIPLAQAVVDRHHRVHIR